MKRQILESLERIEREYVRRGADSLHWSITDLATDLHAEIVRILQARLLVSAKAHDGFADRQAQRGGDEGRLCEAQHAYAAQVLRDVADELESDS